MHRISILFLLALPVIAHGAKEKKQLLWNHWYTVSASKSPYAYYNERVEVIGDKIKFFTDMRKLEEGYINEESIGSVSSKGRSLNPLFFNFRSVYRTTELLIDGTVEGNLLKAKVRESGHEKPMLKRTIPKGVMFSSFFPVWIGLNLKKFKPKQPQSFRALIEDSPKANFPIESGIVRLMPPDRIAKNSKTKFLRVQFRGIRSSWYVHSTGAAYLIEMPTQGLVIRKSTKKAAQSFFKRKKR